MVLPPTWDLFNIGNISIEIEALKAELLEAIDQSKWVQEKLHEIEAQKSEAQNTIRTAERVLQMKTTSTRSEVFRLKGIILDCHCSSIAHGLHQPNSRL